MCIVYMRLSFSYPDATPPTINCTGPQDIYIETPGSSVTLNVAAQGLVSVDDAYPGIRSVTYDPASLTVTYEDLGDSRMVNVTAEDLDGNTATCLFPYTIRGKVISGPGQLWPPACSRTQSEVR